MCKITAGLLIAAVVLLTVANWFYTRRVTAAAKSPAQTSLAQAACRSYVPQEWANIKAAPPASE